MPSFSDGELIYIRDTPYRILSHSGSGDSEDERTLWAINLEANRFVIEKMTMAEINTLMQANQIKKGIDQDEIRYPTLEPGDKELTDFRYIHFRQ